MQFLTLTATFLGYLGLVSGQDGYASQNGGTKGGAGGTTTTVSAAAAFQTAIKVSVILSSHLIRIHRLHIQIYIVRHTKNSLLEGAYYSLLSSHRRRVYRFYPECIARS
jgi:hypothetical protein